VLEGGYAAGRVTSSADVTSGDAPAKLAGLRLVSVLEDDGFLLTRYIRA
jgi:hypothetical protein